jgi:hypothetical protein
MNTKFAIEMIETIEAMAHRENTVLLKRDLEENVETQNNISL